MKTKLTSALIMALTLVLVLTIIPAMAYFNNVSFNGQGLAANSAGGFVLQTEICDKSDGAEVAGPYLFWTLTAPGARNAEIYGPWGDAIMARSGTGTFTFVSEYDRITLLTSFLYRLLTEDVLARFSKSSNGAVYL